LEEWQVYGPVMDAHVEAIAYGKAAMKQMQGVCVLNLVELADSLPLGCLGISKET